MRFREFNILAEDLDSPNGDLSDFIEDDADSEADLALCNTLREIQFSADHAQVPKISVQALVNLVKSKPGGEAFSLEALMKAKQHNDIVKEIIANIKDDENGIKYVFIKPVDSDADVGGEEGEAVKSAPEKTVSSMAKSALAKRS